MLTAKQGKVLEQQHKVLSGGVKAERYIREETTLMLNLTKEPSLTLTEQKEQ